MVWKLPNLNSLFKLSWNDVKPLFLVVWSVFVFGCVSSSLFDKLVMVLFNLSRHLVWTIDHPML